MQRLNDVEEEKKKKEAEKEGKREEKRNEKQSKQSTRKQQKGKTVKRKDKQARVMCIECDTYYDMDEGGNEWIECEICLNWYHTTYVDISEDDLNFICKLCSNSSNTDTCIIIIKATLTFIFIFLKHVFNYRLYPWIDP